MSLPYQPMSFDAVMTVGALIHVHPDDIERVAAGLKRVMKRWILVVEQDRKYTPNYVKAKSRSLAYAFWHNYDRLFANQTFRLGEI